MNKKRVLMVAGLLLGLAIIIGLAVANQYKKQQEALRLEQEMIEREEKEQQRLLENIYVAQNSAFINEADRATGETIGGYIPYGNKVNQNRLLIALHVYEKETGNVVSFEDIKEYLSTPTEPDGSLRLYNNGLHPEIQEYVEWVNRNRYKVDDYTSSLIDISVKDSIHSSSSPFKDKRWSEVTLQEMQELIKKADDPEYVMQFDE